MASEKQIQKWESQLEKLSDRRENNVNRYILPIETKMEELRDKIESASEFNLLKQMNQLPE